MKFFSVNVISCILMLISIPRVEVKLRKRGLPEGAVVGRCPSDWQDSFCSCDVSQETLTLTIQCQGVSELKQLQDAFRRNWVVNSFEWFLLQNSTLESLPDGFLKNLSFLGILITNNNLGKIGRFAFQGSEKSAESIWMSDNNFTDELDFKFLRPLRHLSSVTVSSSNLFSLPDGAFGSLPQLETINLEKNSLRKLGKLAFSLLPKIKRIDLTWNNITHLEKQMLNTSRSEKPVALVLAHNQIEKIDDEAFAGLKAYYVNLQNNKLTTLNQNAFEPLLDLMFEKRNSKLLVDGNPFICDESMQWLASKPLEYRLLVSGCPCIEKNQLMNFAETT